MISFILCLALLIIGYFTYGKVVDNTFGPDDRETPAVSINDGVDYVVMPQWKLFLYSFLTLQDWDLFLVRCRVHCGAQSYFSGSRLVQFLPAVFMTTSLE